MIDDALVENNAKDGVKPKVLEFRKLLYDPENNILWQIFEVERGEITERSLQAMISAKDSTKVIHCTVPIKNFDDIRHFCKQTILSVKIHDRIKYRPKPKWRTSDYPAFRDNNLGFRCVQDVAQNTQGFSTDNEEKQNKLVSLPSKLYNINK